MKSFFSKLWQDESGQGATEYILILVVVAVIVTVFKDEIKEIVRNRTVEMGEKLGGVFE